MKLGLAIGYSGAHLDLPVALVQRAEELGYDSVWSAEAYGSDAIKDEAIANVPDAWVDLKSLVGPPARIRERYRAWEDSGAHSLSMRSRQSEAIEVMAKAARLN